VIGRLIRVLALSFSWGLCLALSLIVAGLILPSRFTPYIDLVFKPGEAVPIFLFGGLHGLAPLIVAVVGEGCLFGGALHSSR
jgi:hypothetical protein